MESSVKIKEVTGRADVSVVIPVYNSEATLLRAVDSIVSQKALPREVLLIDDGSTDSSLKICENVKLHYGKYFQVRIFTCNENLGPSSARNRGWDLSCGKYVAFLDSDDSWDPEKIFVQWNFMENNPSVSITGHLCGLHVTRRVDQVAVTLITPLKILFSNPFSTPTVMVNRSVRHRFLETKRFAEDYHLWMNMVLSGLFVARLEVELAVLHKPKYGATGLSAAMWKMETGEIDAYIDLCRKKLLPRLALFVLIPFSIAKYIKRLIIMRLGGIIIRVK